eukprot:7195511-Lingulodinium_polyedra.AAC.1
MATGQWRAAQPKTCATTNTNNQRSKRHTRQNDKHGTRGKRGNTATWQHGNWQIAGNNGYVPN